MSETSIAQQIVMNNLSMTSQIMQGSFGVISNISNMQKANNNNGISNITVKNSLGRIAYAVEGDSKYKKELDTNGDGFITYNEYVKSITDNISSKYKIPKNSTSFMYGEDSQTGLLTFSVTNMGKVLNAYLNNSIQFPSGLIEQEA